jgi:hypothetical protein
MLAAASASADVLHLKSGGQIEGRIIRKDATSVEIEMGAGTMELPMASIQSIEEGGTTLDEYDARLAELDESDSDGWLALGEWAGAHDLANQSKSAYKKVLAMDPGNTQANKALGNVNVDGRWMSEEDAYVARGFVKFEGRWLTPEDKALIESERRLQAAADAEEDAREAEARAIQAEARARQAEADARAEQEAAEELDIVYWDTLPRRRPIRPLPGPIRPR